MADVRTEEITIEVAGQPMPTFLALPAASTPRPVVLVFEEVFGVNVHIRDVCQRLAREGYVAIAPDYHHRAWKPGTQLGYSAEDMKVGMALIPKLSVEGLNADIGATIDYVKTRKEADATKLGAIGFCIGGHIAYYAAATQPITVTASFYGGGTAVFGPGGSKPTVERTGDIEGRITCFFGADDPMITADQRDKIRAALQAHDIEHEIVVYPGATHGFFCDQRGSYNPTAAADAWERVKKLFAEELA
ncbi:MAG TPA: dienelactone hydrolase family protein [Polyangia bacterium]|jgi:carboxymethylenebutenolidase|nr:dienelactone hydrolase family protein [Polyangia bacterium]